jgi:hypothetical protein
MEGAQAIPGKAEEVMNTNKAEQIVECGGCAPPVIAAVTLDPLAVLRGEQYATVEDVCRAWIGEREDFQKRIDDAPVGEIVNSRANSFGGYNVEIKHNVSFVIGQRVRLMLEYSNG